MRFTCLQDACVFNTNVGVATHLCSTNVTSSSFSSNVLFSCLQGKPINRCTHLVSTSEEYCQYACNTVETNKFKFNISLNGVLDSLSGNQYTWTTSGDQKDKSPL